MDRTVQSRYSDQWNLYQEGRIERGEVRSRVVALAMIALSQMSYTTQGPGAPRTSTDQTGLSFTEGVLPYSRISNIHFTPKDAFCIALSGGVLDRCLDGSDSNDDIITIKSLSQPDMLLVTQACLHLANLLSDELNRGEHRIPDSFAGVNCPTVWCLAHTLKQKIPFVQGSWDLTCLQKATVAFVTESGVLNRRLISTFLPPDMRPPRPLDLSFTDREFASSPDSIDIGETTSRLAALRLILESQINVQGSGSNVRASFHPRRQQIPLLGIRVKALSEDEMLVLAQAYCHLAYRIQDELEMTLDLPPESFDEIDLNTILAIGKSLSRRTYVQEGDDHHAPFKAAAHHLVNDNGSLNVSNISPLIPPELRPQDTTYTTIYLSLASLVIAVAAGLYLRYRPTGQEISTFINNRLSDCAQTIGEQWTRLASSVRLAP